jgi:hypothetical protein
LIFTPALRSELILYYLTLNSLDKKLFLQFELTNCQPHAIYSSVAAITPQKPKRRKIMQTMTMDMAVYLVNKFQSNDYAARKCSVGRWCVWYWPSDHAVEFDQKTLDAAQLATQGHQS